MPEVQRGLAHLGGGSLNRGDTTDIPRQRPARAAAFVFAVNAQGNT